jgi:hypothetical protein
MRHPEPKIVTVWREAMRMKTPRVCHTCEYYTKDGLCQEFDAEPPADFAVQPNACELWCEDLPF